MKKLLLIASLVTASAFGQVNTPRSFIAPGITSFTVSNAAAAPLGFITNLQSVGVLPTGAATNGLGVSYTNSSGTWVIVTNSTPASGTGVSMITNDTTALLADVALYATRNGDGPPYSTNGFPGTGAAGPISGETLMITVSGASGSSGANVNFAFIGLPDGTHEVTTGTVGSGAPIWTVGITPNTTSQVTIYTNVPMWQFAGCSKLRLQKVSSAITTAANIGVTVQAVKLCGFVP